MVPSPSSPNFPEKNTLVTIFPSPSPLAIHLQTCKKMVVKLLASCPLPFENMKVPLLQVHKYCADDSAIKKSPDFPFVAD